jgi:hypothetical protein
MSLQFLSALASSRRGLISSVARSRRYSLNSDALRAIAPSSWLRDKILRPSFLRQLKRPLRTSHALLDGRVNGF